MMLAPNNGYQAGGAIPCSPGATYAFSFWYKGDVPKASVSATGWPSADAGRWQAHSAFRLGRGNVARRRVAEMQRTLSHSRRRAAVCLGDPRIGRQSEGFCAREKLYVDDAEIRPRCIPTASCGRSGAACPERTSATKDCARSQSSLDKIKAGGFNTLFVWTQSGYLAALGPARTPEGRAAGRLGRLGEVIRAAKERSIQVHVWYSPWIYKEKSRAVELRDHPEWAAVSAKGVADPDGVCFVRPEVRQFELDLIGQGDRPLSRSGRNSHRGAGLQLGQRLLLLRPLPPVLPAKLRHRHSQGSPGGEADRS